MINKTIITGIFNLMAIFLMLSGFNAKAVSPKVYAVVIGISRYQESALNLNYADKDAEDFVNFLKSPGCGSTPDDQIALLVNGNATRSNVLYEVEKFSALASANDVFILYFSGHGTNATYNSNFYLMTYDTDEKRVSSTATSANDLKNTLSSCLAKMTFWITDACNAGKIDAGRNGTKGLKTNPSGADIFLKTVAETLKGGFVYIAASESQEVSIEGDQYGGGHGLFTYYLLEGLKGKADDDNDGIITINESFDYVHAQVAKASDGSQHPVLGDLYFNGNFPMATTRNFAGLKIERGKFMPGPAQPLPVPQPDTPPAMFFERSIKVNALINTHIKIKKGEIIVINATGSIYVGQWVGVSGPEGRTSGLLGFPINQYNIVPNFKHAALMYKLENADNWTECGANYKFKAEKDGELIFQVNDNDQGNNHGDYSVNIQKYR